MAVKKTIKRSLKKTVKTSVKKRRRGRKVESIENVVTSLEENSSVSDVNKRALARLDKAAVAVARMEKQISSAQERVAKAVASVSTVKTPAAKEKAKLKVSTAKAALKEVRAEFAGAVSEKRKAERLARGLHKSLVSARAKMAKEFDKLAKAAEKAADKKTRRRRRRKKV